MPESGPGSVAGWGRRAAAIFVDWMLCLLVASVLRNAGWWDWSGGRQWTPLIVFAFEVTILTSLLGGSAGQVLLGIVIRRTNGEPLDAARALLRTLLICLVIPPVIYNRDQQGLHDLAVDSIAVRR